MYNVECVMKMYVYMYTDMYTYGVGRERERERERDTEREGLRELRTETGITECSPSFDKASHRAFRSGSGILYKPSSAMPARIIGRWDLQIRLFERDPPRSGGSKALSFKMTHYPSSDIQ